MKAIKLLGYLTAATAVVLALANWNDIRRYIRITSM